ncbi:hypothetical protein HDU98_003902 [Podochytrium sp. JEL0797]|nr:hypothetical protein HDU98_003902 [Podochytrium sp. JEL0797]
MSGISACTVALTALAQEGPACHMAPSEALANSCYCTTLDPWSVQTYCANEDKSIWESTVTSTLSFIATSCAAAGLPVPTSHPLLALPSGITFSTATPVTSTTTASATSPLSSPTPTGPFSDGSKCYSFGNFTGLTPANAVEITSSSLFTASLCNSQCQASAVTNPKINFSALVQLGPFISCYCLLDFVPTPASGCMSCITYQGHVGFPQQGFANCGVGNPSNGFVSVVAAVPVVAAAATSTAVATTTSGSSVTSAGPSSVSTKTPQISVIGGAVGGGGWMGVVGLMSVLVVFLH